jgi:diguanylate cyclase (GGDEF)-like protein
VLCEVARRVERSVRSGDLVARYGGEELVVVAPSADEATAVQLAERLREDLRSTPIAVGEDRIAVTASLGVALMAPDETSEGLLQRADGALYAAKAAGRDRVFAATSRGVAVPGA